MNRSKIKIIKKMIGDRHTNFSLGMFTSPFVLDNYYSINPHVLNNCFYRRWFSLESHSYLL